MKIIYTTTLLTIMLLISGCSSKQDTLADQTSSKKQQENLEKKDEKITEQVLEETTDSSSIATESIYFNFDKFNIRPNMQNSAINNVQAIKAYGAKNNSIQIILEGNCDNIGTDEYNYALGLKRAKTIKDNLIKNGIKQDSIIIKSLGESSPKCTQNTKECRAQNRRVDYIVK